jgi:hypothetical protein
MADETRRAIIEYRTKAFENDAKWSLCFQRVIESAVDSTDALRQFYADPIWPALTGSIEVKGVSWLD